MSTINQAENKQKFIDLLSLTFTPVSFTYDETQQVSGSLQFTILYTLKTKIRKSSGVTYVEVSTPEPGVTVYSRVFNISDGVFSNLKANTLLTYCLTNFYKDIFVVITFLPRSKRLLISWLQSPSAVILEPQKIKSDTVSPSISHESQTVKKAEHQRIGAFEL